MTERDDKSEETLDPKDWQSLRQLGHRMVDDMFDYLQGLREERVWQPTSVEAERVFREPVPHEGIGAERAYQDFVDHVRPYSMGNAHPRFWGWVMGNGTPLAMLADMLASGINPNMGGGNHAPRRVEDQVVRWCAELMGFPETSSGLLTSGCSVANLIALTVARYRAARAVREHGLGASGHSYRFYGSTEMHSSLDRAVDVLGLGTRSLRRIPVDSSWGVDVEAMRAQIARDREDGLAPIGIIGCAGTVNSGACDDLNALADLAAEHGVWFHVDGAFGALARLSPRYRHVVEGLERADSVSFDLHKWGYLPFEVGCVLVRDARLHRQAFSLTPEYLERAERGIAGAADWHSDLGLQLSRCFRALKVWMTFRAEGVDKIGRIVEQNIEQAKYLAQRASEHPALECVTPVELGIACVRHRAPGLSESERNDFNQELMLRLQEQGTAVFTSTRMNGQTVLRAAITNHRTRISDIDLAIDALVAEGARLLQERA